MSSQVESFGFLSSLSYSCSSVFAFSFFLFIEVFHDTNHRSFPLYGAAVSTLPVAFIRSTPPARLPRLRSRLHPPPRLQLYPPLRLRRRLKIPKTPRPPPIIHPDRQDLGVLLHLIHMFHSVNLLLSIGHDYPLDVNGYFYSFGGSMADEGVGPWSFREYDAHYTNCA